MTFEQLEYFLAVADYKSFTHAAEEVCISQSSLSKHIKAMEDELENKLFIRQGSRLSLTPAGEIFFEFARRGTLEYKNILSQLPKNTSSYLCTLKLGTLPLLLQYNLIDDFSLFHSQNLNIHIDLHEDNQEKLVRMLDNHQLDAAVVRTDYLSEEKYDFACLNVDELVFVCSKTNALAKLKMISIRDLRQERFVILDNKSDTNRLVLDLCRKNGFVPNVTATISIPNPLIGMIAEDIGISVLPSRMVDLSLHKKIAVVPLSDTVHTTLALVKRKTHKMNYGVDQFFAFCKELASERALPKSPDITRARL